MSICFNSFVLIVLMCSHPYYASCRRGLLGKTLRSKQTKVESSFTSSLLPRGINSYIGSRDLGESHLFLLFYIL